MKSSAVQAPGFLSGIIPGADFAGRRKNAVDGDNPFRKENKSVENGYLTTDKIVAESGRLRIGPLKSPWPEGAAMPPGSKPAQPAAESCQKWYA